MLRPLAVTASACLLAGCATGSPIGAQTHWTEFRALGPAAAPRGFPADAPLRSPTLGEGAREAVVSAARAWVGKKRVEVEGRRLGDDCTSLIRAVFGQVNVDVLEDAEANDNGVTAIYRYAQSRGRVFTGGHALPGDLVFFHDTYDQNRDGRDNDGLTHVGLVESVDSDGTVQVIHRVLRGVVRYRMNLAHPELRADPKTGQAINDYLRPARRGKPAVLTGQLFAAYATLFTAEPIARR